NYDAYFTEGDAKLSQLEDYNSDNTKLLDVAGMVDLLYRLEYVQQEAEAWRQPA
ncbi:MAG: hypothetical protein KDD78_04925, partial [Caldilineaceae bacterium]|nr:hypothetical protein [Caldilineaceae bacterium]